MISCLWALFPLLISAAGPPLPGQSAVSDPDTAQVYTYRQPSRDGSGKIYLGREISRILGHRGAAWLDRPAREAQEKPELLVSSLPLEPTDTVADIGAGTGYFTFRISPLVPKGQVLAVDIQPEMLAIIRRRMDERRVTNVTPVLGAVTDPHLPENGVDLVLMVDAYHEFSHPREMMEAVVRALKPGGLVVLIEYRGEDPGVRRKPLHKMTVAQARKELAVVGLRWRETRDILPQQHFMVFEKP